MLANQLVGQAWEGPELLVGDWTKGMMFLAGSTHFDGGILPILPYLWLASNYICVPS